MAHHTYHLQSLLYSDFKIVDGEPDIIGWEIKNENGVYIGEVTDLLFDPEVAAVRYLAVDLTNNGMQLEKTVLIPIGIAHLHISTDEVTLPNIHIDQFNALPAYVDDEVDEEMEMQIREVIGSPAALRIEETIIEFDQSQFYNHHHFDKDKFYQRNKSAQNITE